LAKFRGDFVRHRNGTNDFRETFGLGLARVGGHRRARSLISDIAPRRFADGTGLSGKDVPMNPADVAQSVLPLTSSDLSLFTLFWNAHWVVKTVMIGLLVCSVWVWAIAIDKTVLYTRTRRAMDRFEQAFWSGQSLDELYRALSSRPAHSMAALFVAAMREWKRSFEGSSTRSFAGLQMRIEKVMEVTIAREVERLEKRLLVLATVGSAGPFVGLFGTVWGIMTSFQSIAASKNTSLAVVAPGIAEALFATALGLVAAIPATIFYNKFAAEVNRQAQRLEGFADEFAAILSRQIDERG
jgi:biopolymer transport protein TolQ